MRMYFRPVGLLVKEFTNVFAFAFLITSHPIAASPLQSIHITDYFYEKKTFDTNNALTLCL